jgi:hypothetical protein
VLLCRTTKCQSRISRESVDRLPLSAPVLVIDPVTLVVARQEAGADELGNGAAHVIDFHRGGLAYCGGEEIVLDYGT